MSEERRGLNGTELKYVYSDVFFFVWLPREDSDEEESGSGTDEEAEAEGQKKKKEEQSIPDWARGQRLKEALERQYGLAGYPPMDPDLIFPEVQTCSLEEIFGCAEGASRK